MRKFTKEMKLIRLPPPPPLFPRKFEDSEKFYRFLPEIPIFAFGKLPLQQLPRTLELVPPNLLPIIDFERSGRNLGTATVDMTRMGAAAAAVAHLWNTRADNPTEEEPK